MILTRKRLLVEIFLTLRLSKLLTFCKFASVNFELWRHDQAKICLADQHDWQQSESYVTK